MKCFVIIGLLASIDNLMQCVAFVLHNPLSKKSNTFLNYSDRDKVKEDNIKRAVRNKEKREPAINKKRRLLKFFKSAQHRKKLESKVKRRFSLWDEENRCSLSSLKPGMELNGRVISFTDFGTYIDVNTEIDGLLHISQMSDGDFIQNPKHFLQIGDDINVTVYRVSSELKKLWLTMLPNRVYEKSIPHPDSIELDSLREGDEVWGEIVRVTDYGAYVELGATVRGFLHFMDDPAFSYRGDEPIHPSELMSVGQRVRGWVQKIELDRNRIQITCFRPKTAFMLRRI